MIHQEKGQRSGTDVHLAKQAQLGKDALPNLPVNEGSKPVVGSKPGIQGGEWKRGCRYWRGASRGELKCAMPSIPDFSNHLRAVVVSD